MEKKFKGSISGITEASKGKLVTLHENETILSQEAIKEFFDKNKNKITYEVIK